MRSIRWRLMLAYLAVTSLSTVALAIFLVRAVERSYVEERLQMLGLHARLVRSQIGKMLGREAVSPELHCMAERLSQCLRTRIILTSASGRPLVDTALKGATPGTPGASCAPGRFGCRLCHGDPARSSRLQVNVGLGEAGLGRTLTLSASSAGLDRMMERVHTVTLTQLLLSLAAIGVVSVYLASGIASPIQAMSRMARRMAEGDLDQRVPVKGRDEVAELAAGLNEMAARVRSGMDAVSRAMDALAEEKSKLETVVLQMADGILVTDAEGRVVLVNPVSERCLGIPASTAVGQQVFGGSFSPELQRAVSRALAGDSVADEVHIRYPNPLVLGLRASPFRDGQGRTQGAIIVLQDLTEVRRLAELQRDFVANASHELRTPVAALQAATQTLQRGAKDDPAARDCFVEMLAQETDRLSALLSDLLDLSRLEARASAPVKRPVRVAGALSEARSLVWPALSGRHLSFLEDVPDDLEVPADPVQLTQVLANLLSNAFRYTPDGGTVRVSAAHEPGAVRISVSDTGIGIDPSEQERVFERFYRADKGRSRALGGTGLGLAIVREAVEAHGGTVSLESEPGKGSTFTVVLPTS